MVAWWVWGEMCTYHVVACSVKQNSECVWKCWMKFDTNRTDAALGRAAQQLFDSSVRTNLPDKSIESKAINQDGSSPRVAAKTTSSMSCWHDLGRAPPTAAAAWFGARHVAQVHTLDAFQPTIRSPECLKQHCHLNILPRKKRGTAAPCMLSILERQVASINAGGFKESLEGFRKRKSAHIWAQKQKKQHSGFVSGHPRGY